MTYLDWHVGMKVVCTKRGGWIVISGNPPRLAHPKYGEVCTISRLKMCDDGLYIGLQGFPSNSSYDARRFRPVQKRATSIEVFTALLKPSRVTA